MITEIIICMGCGGGPRAIVQRLVAQIAAQASLKAYLQFPVHSPTGPEKHGFRVVKKLSLPPVMPLSSISPAGLAGSVESSAGLRLIT